MQFNVIRGPEGSGKTTRLRQMAREFGAGDKILEGSSNSAESLKRGVMAAARRGERHVFIDDCSQACLEAMRGWMGIPGSMVVHVVLSAPAAIDALAPFFDELDRLDAQRPAVKAAGLAALKRLVPVALQQTGQSQVVGRVLLGLYDGRAFPFELTALRCLDAQVFEDCMAVLRLDQVPEQEVHEYLPDGQQVFDRLVALWR